MTYSIETTLQRGELSLVCNDLIETETFYEEVFVDTSKADNYLSFFDDSVKAARETAEGLIKKHGAGVFEVRSFFDVSKQADCVRVYLTIFRIQK